MRIVVAVLVERIPYRFESQEQTLFEALAQRGGDNRFNGPLGACQKKELSGLSFVKQSVQTNSHRTQERGGQGLGLGFREVVEITLQRRILSVDA